MKDGDKELFNECIATLEWARVTNEFRTVTNDPRVVEGYLIHPMFLQNFFFIGIKHVFMRSRRLRV
jgi:hypothetical protein